MRHRRIFIAVLFVVVVFATPSMARHDGNATSAEVESADRALVLNEFQRLWSINEHCPWGIPRGADDATSEILLIQHHYLLRFDNDLQCPIWVAYHLTAEDVQAPTIPKRSGKRVEAFRAEPRFRPDVIDHYRSPTLDDHENDSYDRGHMVPHAQMYRSMDACLNTYVLTNMAPQLPSFNRHTLARFEARLRDWADAYGQIWVVTGSIFDRHGGEEPGEGDRQRDPDNLAERNKPSGALGVPSHFFEIIVGYDIAGLLFISLALTLER